MHNSSEERLEMIKKILFSIVVLLVLFGAGAYFYFDSIVKSGIEVVGSRVLGTPVTVSSVALSPLSGSGGISDLRIANPEGYSEDYIFELGYVSVNINAGTVLTDVVEIESVTIAQPVITYETRITTDNVRALLANLPGGANEPAAGAEGESGKKLIIRELQILNPQLNLSAGLVSAPIQLPDIVLHDIGSDNQAATVAEVLRQVIVALQGAISRADLPSAGLLRESIESSVEDGVERAGQVIDDAVENLGNRLRGVRN